LVYIKKTITAEQTSNDAADKSDEPITDRHMDRM